MKLTCSFRKFIFIFGCGSSLWGFENYNKLFLFFCKGDEVFKINTTAGTGAYAKVFSAIKVDPTSVNAAPVALKVCRNSFSTFFLLAACMHVNDVTNGQCCFVLSSLFVDCSICLYG